MTRHRLGPWPITFVLFLLALPAAGDHSCGAGAPPQVAPPQGAPPQVVAADPGEKPASIGASQGRTVRVLVAYYSLTGNTKQMAQGVADGAQRVPGVVAVVKEADQVSKQDLVAADAIILGCPTYFAGIPGKMKTAIDDWNWKMKVDFTDKVGGAFSTGGGQVGGKEFVVVSLLLFMVNNRMVVAGPLYQDAEGDDKWAEAGASAMTGPLDPGVSPQELDSARLLGERISRLAKKLRPD